MYTLIINKIIQYKIILDNFTQTQSLSFRTNETIRIFTQGLIAGLKLNIQLRINNKLKIVSLKLHQRLLTIIKFRMVYINATAKMKSKLSQIFNISLKNSFIILLKQKAFTIISIPNKIIYSPLLGKFLPLSTYDPQTLSSLDGQTLSNMDYITT